MASVKSRLTHHHVEALAFGLEIHAEANRLLDREEHDARRDEGPHGDGNSAEKLRKERKASKWLAACNRLTL